MTIKLDGGVVRLPPFTITVPQSDPRPMALVPAESPNLNLPVKENAQSPFKTSNSGGNQ